MPDKSDISRSRTISNLVHLLSKAALRDGEIFYFLKEAEIGIES